MRKIILLLTMIGCVSLAKAQDVINYFEISGEVIGPVTIYTNDGKIVVSNGQRKDGNLMIYSAYDVNGNQIVNTTPYKTSSGTNKPTIRYYRFQSVYKESSADDGVYNSSNSDGLEQSINQTTEVFKRTQGQLIDAAVGLSNIEMRGYPNLQLRGGMSLLYGEYAALHAELGGKGGWILGAGIGKDFIRGDETVTWYGDFGMYMGNEQDLFIMGFIFGKNCTAGPKFSLFRSWEDTEDTESRKMLRRFGMYIGWEHYFWSVPRLGFFAIAQLNFGSYDLCAGLSWKVFANIR